MITYGILGVLIVEIVKSHGTKPRGFIFKKEQNLVYKCHNCGVGKSLKNFLDFVDSKICKDYILETYKKTQPQEEEYDIGKFQKPRFLKGATSRN